MLLLDKEVRYFGRMLIPCNNAIARPNPSLKTGHKKRKKERGDKDSQGQNPKEQATRVYREQAST
jgi:hypothetical protein